MFPEELPRRCIKMFSWKGANICDPFSGAGTTAVVCKKLNRNFIGFEISQDYCNISKKRLQEIDMPLAVKTEGGNGLPPTDKSMCIRPTIL